MFDVSLTLVPKMLISSASCFAVTCKKKKIFLFDKCCSGLSSDQYLSCLHTHTAGIFMPLIVYEQALQVRVATVREKSLEDEFFSRSGKSQGISILVREI